MNVYAMYDHAIQAFGIPLFYQTDKAAIRAFTDEINRDSATNLLYLHPEDYELFAIGTFDDNTAKFDQGQPLAKLIAHGKAVSKSQTQGITMTTAAARR